MHDLGVQRGVGDNRLTREWKLQGYENRGFYRKTDHDRGRAHRVSAPEYKIVGDNEQK